MRSMKLLSVFIVLSIFAAFVFSGCIGTISEETGMDNEEERKKSGFSYTETVAKFLDLYQNADERADDYIKKSEDNDGICYDGLSPLIAKQMSYKINPDKEQQKDGKVAVTIENIDFSKVFQDVMKEKKDGESAEEILDQLEEMIASKDAPKKKYDCIIEFEPDGDTYYIRLNNDLIEALYGGYNAY